MLHDQMESPLQWLMNEDLSQGVESLHQQDRLHSRQQTIVKVSLAVFVDIITVSESTNRKQIMLKDDHSYS